MENRKWVATHLPCGQKDPHRAKQRGKPSQASPTHARSIGNFGSQKKWNLKMDHGHFQEFVHICHIIPYHTCNTNAKDDATNSPAGMPNNEDTD